MYCIHELSGYCYTNAHKLLAMHKREQNDFPK